MLKEWAKRLTGIDVETTGLGPDARIVEFGAVLQENGFVVKVYNLLLRPDGVDWESPSVKEAMGINKIKVEEVFKAKSYCEQFETIKSALTQSDVRVGHNLNFDLDMLKREFMLGLQSGQLTKEMAAGPKVISLDTIGLDAYLMPDAGSRALDKVAARWHVHSWQKHRAIGDADAAVRILLNMSFHLPEDISEVERISKEFSKKHQDYYREKRNAT
jgi:DNA polymerase III alpha subunit (gram-positive type)